MYLKKNIGSHLLLCKAVPPVADSSKEELKASESVTATCKYSAVDVIDTTPTALNAQTAKTSTSNMDLKQSKIRDFTFGQCS